MTIHGCWHRGLSDHVWAHTLYVACSLSQYTFIIILLFLLHYLARVQPAPVDRFGRSILHTTCFHAGKCLLGVSFTFLPIRGPNPPKNPQFWGRKSAFSSLTSKIKMACNRNYCSDSNQILHRHKDHQVLLVGGPNTRKTNPTWRTANVWPSGTKFGMVTHIGRLNGTDLWK